MPSKPSLRYHFLPHSLIPLSFSNAIYPPMTFWALTPLSLSLILRCLFPPLTAILPELLLEWGHSFCLEHLSAHARKIISCFCLIFLPAPNSVSHRTVRNFSASIQQKKGQFGGKENMMTILKCASRNSEKLWKNKEFEEL